MNQPLFERERINKRFQSQPGRPHAARYVDLAVDVDLVEIGGTNLREHLHRARVDQHGGRVFNSTVSTPGYVIGDSSLDRLLLLKVERGRDFVPTARFL